MSAPRLLPLQRALRRLGRDDEGTTLVELAFVIPLLLLLFFGILDFGRLAYNYVAAEKALQVAARLAVVRPAVCSDVPAVNERGENTDPRFGTRCNSAANVCKVENPDPCTAGDGNLSVRGKATADTIWARIAPLMPAGTDKSNLQFTYSYDENLGFLGGPFVPVVTVELVGLDFQFLGVLGGLAQLAGAVDTGDIDDMESDGVPFNLSVSLPGEDLALGTDG